MKIKTLSLLVSMSLTSFVGHANTNLAENSVQHILKSDLNTLWSQGFEHHQKGLLKDVAQAIEEETKKDQISSKSLARLTYYLRIFSSFGPDKDWQEGTAQELNNALQALTNMGGFFEINVNSARLHENYAVALYRLYFLAPLQKHTGSHTKVLSKLLNLYANSKLPNSTQVDFALWEIIRASAILPYEARRKNVADFSVAVQEKSELEQSLLGFLSAKNATLNGSDWPKKNALWALAQHYNLYNQQYWNKYYTLSPEEKKLLDDDKKSLPFEAQMDDLDNGIWASISAQNLSESDAKTLFSIPYVVSTFRGKSECTEDTLKGRCITPTVEQALPIKYDCSDSVYILTQDMTREQLKNSCKALNSQVDDFHTKLATQKKPVANDFNDKLRIVIFDDAAQYNMYGQLTFDIHTDNGGMYIEGTTQDPDNVATFYTYEHFWIRPEFGVWNLNHEFVHYLDGRFIKYDTYGHFPGNLVWWSEGLAEYISKGDENPRAFKYMAEAKVEDWPSLLDVFNTEYKDGTDQVYKWGYLAVRFMFEKHQDEYLKMAHFLKTDFFKGYKNQLEESAKNHGEEFTQWLLMHKKNHTLNGKVVDKTKPRQFYRYTDKNYLRPAHLVESKEHMLWQYWHENALKNK